MGNKKNSLNFVWSKNCHINLKCHLILGNSLSLYLCMWFFYYYTIIIDSQLFFYHYSLLEEATYFMEMLFWFKKIINNSSRMTGEDVRPLLSSIYRKYHFHLAVIILLLQISFCIDIRIISLFTQLSCYHWEGTARISALTEGHHIYIRLIVHAR